MTGMGYTTTLVVLSHVLHAYIERSMKTKDVTHQMLRNDLDRSLKDCLYTSKEEMTREVETRSCDEIIDNVCHQMTICDHLLSLRPGDTMIRNLYGESHSQRSQDIYGYSGNAWKSSWENQRGGVILHGQTYQNNNGNYYGKVKQCGRNTANSYGKLDTRRLPCFREHTGEGIQIRHDQVPHVKRMPTAAEILSKPT
jgi:hypothetical protein